MIFNNKTSNSGVYVGLVGLAIGVVGLIVEVFAAPYGWYLIGFMWLGIILGSLLMFVGIFKEFIDV